MNELALAVHNLVSGDGAPYPSTLPNLSARERAALEDLRSLPHHSGVSDLLGQVVEAIDWYTPPSVTAKKTPA